MPLPALSESSSNQIAAERIDRFSLFVI